MAIHIKNSTGRRRNYRNQQYIVGMKERVISMVSSVVYFWLGS